MDDELLPRDPGDDDERFQTTLLGMHTMARILGTLKREFEAEGFSDEEAFRLTETWMVNTFTPGCIEEEDD